jgi:sugar/nucleoside kinase (ribokinase family)
MCMSKAAIDVLTIGNAIVDVLARVDEDFVARHQVVKGSMTLIDEKRALELYGAMGQAVEISGGSAANTAAGVASFGGKAAFIGKVKRDQLGDVFAHDMTATGVRYETVRARSGPATARSFIMVTPDGERTMNTFLGACVNLGPDDIDPSIVSDAKITYLEGYLWDPPQAKEAFKKAAKIARKAKRKVSITLSDSFCVDRHRSSFLDLIRGDIDIVFANEKEIKSLYETDDFDETLQKIRKDCEIAVLTRSEAGCVVVKGSEVHVVEAHPVAKVVDVTGAGDLFASGFLHGYTNGLGLAQSARLGSLAAAEVISHIGARPEVRLADHAKAAGLL